MNNYCVEEITMGFVYPEPKSVFYGHFETEEDAIIWARNKYKGWKEIEEGQTFFQKDFGASVKEVNTQDCNDEDFIKYSKYSESKILPVS